MKSPLLLALLVSTSVLASAALPPDGTILPLWPEGVPAQQAAAAAEQFEDGRYSAVHEPTLTYYAAGVDRANGTTVVVCPGGGYSILSWEREGIAYAKWLNHLGVSAFLLKSRLKEYGHPYPLQDVLRAIRTVRSRAQEFGVDPEHIGVMGSSAGGHLAASASTLFDHPDGKTGAEIDAVSARPDFAILMYPVISMVDGVTHNGSRTNITRGDSALLKLLSLEDQVTAATPPTIIIHTQDDRSVPVANALRYYDAMCRAGVPGELYIFQHGPHGMAMNPGLGTASDWPARAAAWLRDRDLIATNQ
ncbi:alpha/beta hydrolase [Synoicihabitans lomoniglobus]|uniref:Alpha/beta hydrolase n=1 Tax=Synoicihabitans lomoniglobus TaxID=2909285 RepID=A0AAE9ZU07_9BACT|nr:alpha/beta hydrolase [Opitutaceae bacterium LMO-M01]WED64261.1 alpha/beta hydrolase [Opitutaceae bacterium LMO-M01]